MSSVHEILPWISESSNGILVLDSPYNLFPHLYLWNVNQFHLVSKRVGKDRIFVLWSAAALSILLCITSLYILSNGHCIFRG